MRVATPLLFGALLAAPAAAATVVVSPGGPLTTLQAGIDAAVEGDTVQVLAGVYVGDFDVNKNRLTIVAVGDVTLNGNGVFTGAKRCIFRGFTVTGSTIGLDLDANSHGNLLSNLAVSSSGTIAVQISGNRNALVNSTAVAPDTGVDVGGAQNALVKVLAGPTTNDDAFSVNGSRQLVSGCAAVNPGDDGFDLGGRGHLITKCVATNASGAGFRIGGSASVVTGCAANANTESGATIDGDGNLVSKCRFGVLGGNAGAGVAFDGADGNVLTGCTIFGNAGGGITLGILGNGTDNRIERNKVLSNTGVGILLSASGNADDNWVERNLVVGNTGNGITLSSDHNVLISNKGFGNGGGLVDTGTGNLLISNNML